MKHITKYYDRVEAFAAYKRHRKTWSRVAALFLCQKDHAVDPALRLASALTLAKMQVPLNGVYEYRPYSYNGTDFSKQSFI